MPEPNSPIDNSAEYGIINNTTNAQNLLKQKKREILAQNRKKGKLFEIEKFKEFSSQYTNAQEQVTIVVYGENDTKITIRADAIGFDAEGNIVIAEFKSSETAPFTDNQKKAFKIIKERGGMIVTKQKGIFKHGMEISAGISIKIVRPGGVTEYVDTGKKQS